MAETRITLKPHVATRTVSGTEVAVEVTTDLSFRCTVGGETLYATDWKSLEGKIQRVLRTQKIEHKIQVVLQSGGAFFGSVIEKAKTKYIRATLRGKNARTGEYLFTLDGGAKVAIDSPTLVCLGNEITDDELLEACRLGQLHEEAQRLDRDFIRRFKDKGPRILSAAHLIAKAERKIVGEEEQ